MKKPSFGIIGAKGKMGSAFSAFFRKKGFDVMEADLDTEISARELIEACDITIFSVPIKRTAEIISELAPHAREDALLADLTSIKTPAVEAFKAHAPKSCEILGLHPMFGPHMVADMSKQVIAACPVRTGTWTTVLLQQFHNDGAIVKETTPEKHDHLMSIIQGLTHLSAIATGMAMKELGFDIEESMEFSSPVYRLRLDMVGRILSQSSDLYADIALENPLTKDSFKAYQKAIDVLMKTIKKKDHVGFTQAFEETAEYLDGFKDEAYQRTSELIQRSKDLL